MQSSSWGSGRTQRPLRRCFLWRSMIPTLPGAGGRYGRRQNWRVRAANLLHKRASVKENSLFDGQSLAGWEGDTNVWRVRDGVIVGGSMAGNPQNEFLTTTRGYTNFDLRLEYKLTGTEGFINSG